MPVGDIYQVRIVATTSTQIGVNVWHYQVTAIANPEATPAQIAAAIDALAAPKYKPLMTAQATYLGTGVTKIRPLPAGIEATTKALTGAGTVAGDPLPKQVSGIITLTTALAGRANRGRKYIPFPAETDNSVAGNPTAGYVTNLTNLAMALIATIVVANGGGSSTLNPVVYHRAAGTVTTITGWNARADWATQRRRGDYGRRNQPPF